MVQPHATRRTVFATHGWPNKRNDWHALSLPFAGVLSKSVAGTLRRCLIENLTRDIDEAYRLNFINGLLAEVGVPDGVELVRS